MSIVPHLSGLVNFFNNLSLNFFFTLRERIDIMA